VLHPQHKLRYFKATQWEDEWIDAVEQIIRDKFEWKYANLPGDSSDEEGNSIPLPKKKRYVFIRLINLNLLTLSLLGT